MQGTKTVVLGGSYASGSQRPDSDIDLGLYYNDDAPLDIAHIRKIAEELNDLPHPVVTNLGEWGSMAYYRGTACGFPLWQPGFRSRNNRCLQ